ncbi:MAG: single-stranded-DNA-specific exonuclease RecJ [Planctomycetaceae bacterium]|nr:single-stranded-DNA-specific exonuclease RecJ [Planctomycetaceae bacterium]
MPKRWVIRSFDKEQVIWLEHQAHVHPLLAQLLIGRGVSQPEEVSAFLNPKLTGLRDPSLLPGCTETAKRLLDAIKNDRKITVYGDYDVDGMTGTAILWQAVRLLGGQVDYYVPARLTEGYGLNHEAIRHLAGEGTQVIVTVDCGINSIEESRTAKELGIELLITDHHTPGAELPDVAAITHPQLTCPQHGDYPFRELSGSTVALKVAWALCQLATEEKQKIATDTNSVDRTAEQKPISQQSGVKVSAEMRSFLMQAVGLAALGTVADVMPLIDENRALVRFALERSLRENAPPGLVELMKTAKIDTSKTLTAENISFGIAPRLNAAGRLGLARFGVELLVTDKRDRAVELAQYINNLNETRQKAEREITRSAIRQVDELFSPDDPAYVLADSHWHAGIIGIVAGRLVEKYNKPVVLIAKDKMERKAATGSARTVKGLNLYETLEACSDHLVRFGGHAAAAGLTIEESQIDLFREAFCDQVATTLSEEWRVAELVIDAEFPLSAFDTSIVNQIETLAPFGQNNMRPVICTRGVTLAEPSKTMGSDQRHFTATFRQHEQTMRAVAFGAADWVDEMNACPGPIDVAFHPVINEFRGFAKVELQLLDWRPSDMSEK